MLSLPEQMSSFRNNWPPVVTSPFLQGLVTAVGPLFGAVYAGFAGLHPTGDPVADVIWSAIFGGALAFVTARAHPALWIACSALTAVTVGHTAIGAGYGLAIVGLWTAHRHGFFNSSSRPGSPLALRAAAGALIGPLLFGLDDLGRPGLSAAIAGVSFLVLAFVVLAAVDSRRRKILLKLSIVPVVGLVVLGLSSLSLVSSLSSSIRDTEHSARASASAVRAGDFEEVFVELHRTDASLSRAVDHLSRRTSEVLRLVPVAGHNIEALEEILVTSHQLVRSTSRVGAPSERLGAVFSDGEIVPDQLHLLRTDLDEVVGDLVNLQHVVSRDDASIWVAPPITTALDQVADQLGPVFEGSEEFDTINTVLPELLGMESPRRYLVIFGNPAEARELGGFTGATAVLELDQGALDLRTAGRRSSNRNSTSVAALTETPPVRFLEHRPWRFEHNYSAMADFPTLSRALRDLFPAMGGDPIDGVIYLDPFALEALVSTTGPITIPSLGGEIQAEDVPELLLVDQYERFAPGPERDAFFGELFTGVQSAFQAGDFSLDRRSTKQILDVIEQDRLLFAPLDPFELAAADALDMTGRIAPISPGNDYLAVSHLNSGGNKLDTYLQRSVSYEVSLEEESESLNAAVEIELRNEAPLTLPAYAAGDVSGIPGTSRITLVVHTPHEIVSWEGLTEEPEFMRSFREFDRWRHEAVVVLEPRESRIVQLNLEGTYLEKTYKLAIDHQPLVTTDDFSVSVHRGAELESSEQFSLTEDTSFEFLFDERE